MMLDKLIAIVCALLFVACHDATKSNPKVDTTVTSTSIPNDSLVNQLKDNGRFIGDSLLKGKRAVMDAYLATYQPDSCGIITYENTDLKKEFEGIKNVGDINGDGINDTVFVMVPFKYCDDGEAYVFFDTSLPRLLTDSYCCHPDNLFSIGDIDEDGFAEICIFYSSCASRFKALIAYSLKGGKWKEIGRCGFDIAFMKPNKEKRVRKVGKGKFEMLQIIDKETQKEWVPFSF